MNTNIKWGWLKYTVPIFILTVFALLFFSYTLFGHKVFIHRDLLRFFYPLRAFSRRFLEEADWQHFSDDFLFDAQILIKAAQAGFRIAEIPIETRYFKETSQVDFFTGVRYGLGILWELAKYCRS